MVKGPIVQIRKTIESDLPYLVKWLNQPDVLKGFPMCNEQEVRDSVQQWMPYIKIGASLTALYKKNPCGCAKLYIQAIEKLRHQCLFVIVVGDSYRGQGIGNILMKRLIEKAKEDFHIELLHLEVYERNPAISWYRRLGFVEYGRHPRYLKDLDGTYYDKILMQKTLIE